MTAEEQARKREQDLTQTLEATKFDLLTTQQLLADQTQECHELNERLQE